MSIHPIGSVPICAVDNAGQPTPFYAATSEVGDNSDLTYLLLLRPYKLGVPATGGVRARPIGTAPICDVPGAGGGSATVELQYSDTGYVAPAFGNNASVYFDGRMTQPLRMSWSLPIVPEADRRVALEVSNIELINADGALDSVLDSYDVGGREAIVLFGKKGYAFDQFGTIWSGRAVEWSQDFKTVQLSARDNGYLLDIPLQTARYAGTGGAEGAAVIAGKLKPLCFGTCFVVTPQLIDPVHLIYQVHNGPVFQQGDIYDKGAILTHGVITYTSYADLVAATVAPGTYVRADPVGMFRLGSAPAGNLTVNVIGDAGSYDGVNLYGSLTQIFRRICTGYGGLSSAQLTDLSYAGGDDALGIYLDGSEVITVADMLSRIMSSVNGWWGALPDGRFTLGVVDVPNERDVAEELNVWDIQDVALIENPEGSAPRFRTRMGYERRWTVQQPADLAGVVTQDWVLSFGQPYRIETMITAQTQSDYLLAQDPPLFETDRSGSSSATITRVQAMLGVKRRTYRVSVGVLGHRIPRGCCVAVTHPRVNGGNRWLGRYIGADIDASRRQHDLILWG